MRENLDTGIIFLVGARRTGSTLLHNLLCSSVDTHRYAGEFQILTKILDAFSWGHHNFDRLVRFYFRDLDHLTRFQSDTIRALVAEAITTLAPRRCAIFKNPELSFHVVDLAAALPKAKFVATVRDPRDQAASERAVAERQRQVGMRSGAIPTARQLAVKFRSYYDALWRLHENEPGRLTFVRYEDIVQKPEITIQELCTFLSISTQGIDPSRTWDFGDVDVAAMKARPSWSDHYGQPLSAERIGTFLSDFTPSEIHDIEEETVFIRQRFGYGANVSDDMAVRPI